jgi:hypothetical protein
MKSFLGILEAVLAAFFVVWGIPAITTSFDARYGFDPQSYLEVFIHRHHDVLSWFQRGWPESIVPICILLAPFLGGLILHSAWSRGRPAGASRRGVLSAALTFAACYFLVAVSFAAIATAMHPYPFGGWAEFFRFQGARQLVTLFVLAAVLSALGAYVADSLGWTRPRSQGSL